MGVDYITLWIRAGWSVRVGIHDLSFCPFSCVRLGLDSAISFFSTAFVFRIAGARERFVFKEQIHV